MTGVNELAATSSSGHGFNPSTLILILIVVVAFYFLMIRPQQRRKQQAQQQKATMQVGSRVRTTAGMYATVVDVDGDDVVLEIAPGVEVRYMARAIMEVVSSPDVDETTDVEFEQAEENEPEYYADAEAEDDSDALDTDETPDAAPAEPTSEVPAEDADESAYEQATGIKKD